MTKTLHEAPLPTGASQTLDVSSPYFTGIGWRPGQDGEVWLSDQSGTAIARPGSSPSVEIPGQILSSYGWPLGDAFVFTRVNHRNTNPGKQTHCPFGLPGFHENFRHLLGCAEILFVRREYPQGQARRFIPF